MKKGMVLLLIVFSMSLFGDEFTSEDILNSYSKIFSIEAMEYKGKKFISVQVKESNDPVFSELTDPYFFYLTYLITNGSKYDHEKFKKAENKDKLNELFYDHLKKDHEFNKLVVPVISRFLISKGHSMPSFKPEEDKSVTISEIKHLRY